jgi:hypothetical protein
MLVIGEAHGRPETGRVLERLAHELDAHAIALEWSHEEADAPLQRFLRDGVLDFSHLPPTAEVHNGDGRVTPELLAALRRLRDEGRLAQLIAYDRLDPDPPVDWETRDREMAERLLEQWDRRHRVLVLTGAFHAQLECAEGTTMAMHLARALPGLQTAAIAYPGIDDRPATPIVLPVDAD